MQEILSCKIRLGFCPIESAGVELLVNKPCCIDLMVHDQLNVDFHFNNSSTANSPNRSILS